jgi:surfactin synthase thioesterase subunit
MTTTSARRWLVGTASRTQPIRLYCFPHGGGSVAEYVRWAPQLPGVEVWGVQLPGRGTRIAEPPLLEMAEVAAAIAHEVPFVGPYAFFGHSLGALVAYEVSKKLRDAGARLPDRLLLSGYPAPELARTHSPIHHWPDEQFLAEVDRRHGGLPAEVHSDASLRAAVLPALRTDFQVLETYRHQPEAPLPCPITAMAGVDDHISIEELQAWGGHTAVGVTVCRFPGGHFYLHERRDRVLRTLATQLRNLTIPEQDRQC